MDNDDLQKYKLSPVKYPAIAFITSSFVLSWGVVFFTIWRGEGGNTLHSSAQSWSFVVILATLATFGLASIPSLMSAAKPPMGPTPPAPPA
jgi:hypothetical protein